MFKRLRQLRISLAAKCQILFGAAVLLIIGAALAVPWQRMEQLTGELNDRTAGALADEALAEHIRTHRGGMHRETRSTDTTQPVDASTSEIHDDRLPLPPKLLPLAPKEPGSLESFDRKAIARFKKDPGATPYTLYYRLPKGNYGYRFARGVFLGRQCTACHGTVPESQPATMASIDLSSGPVYPLTVDRNSRLAGVITVDIPSRIQENQLLLNRVFILGAGLLAGTLAILSFYLITTRLILQPVRVLQETAEKVSQGDLNIRSDINTGDEFQQLSETLNTMLANLKQSADQLRAVNKGLDLKLGQLAESNVALYESNRLKSEFLANVSHELRTPLNSILGFADLLKDSVAGNGDQRSARYVNNILLSGKNLLELINDLLDLAKIEAGKMDIRSEPLSITDLFEGLANILKPLTEAKQIVLDLSVAASVPIIWTDPGKLQQILYNFLSNAIKFSPMGGKIELAADRSVDERVRISVSDYGPGVETEKQQMIFEKFRQADASHTRSHGGTGLGLAISKELTSLLGGSIGVRSTVGKGATFWIAIPLKIEAGAMDVRADTVH